MYEPSAEKMLLVYRTLMQSTKYHKWNIKW